MAGGATSGQNLPTFDDETSVAFKKLAVLLANSGLTIQGPSGAAVSQNNPVPVSCGPSGSVAAVTVDVNFSQSSRGVYVGVTGDVTAIINGSNIQFKAVPAGMILPIIATKITSSGTTATNMVAFF